MTGTPALRPLPPAASSPPSTEPDTLPLIATFRSTLPEHLRRHLYNARALAQERVDAQPTTLLSTIVTPFDHLLEGGLPRGRLVELVGRRSSGRFATALSALAAATASGEAAALVDLGDGLDPQTAVEVGAVLERLLWVRPEHLKQALIGTEMLLNGGFPLVILDLGNPPVPGGRGAEASWLRLARAAASHRAALLVTSPYRVSGTAAAVVVNADRSRPVWSGCGRSPRLLTGLASRLTLGKLRGQHASGTETLELVTPTPPGLRDPHPTQSSRPLGPYSPTPGRGVGDP